MATDPKDLGDTIGSALGRIAREATHAVSQNGHRKRFGSSNDNMLSGMRGVVAGAALATAAPLAAKGAEKVVKNAVSKRVGSPSGLASKAAENVKGTVTDAVGKSVEQAGGAPGVAKEVGKQMLPGGGDNGGDGAEGVGKGRRMPVQQAVDVGVPLQVAYDQWTQFEDWPQFMHRLVTVTQEDEAHVSFKTKLWGFSKEFVAEIVEQRPDERIQWQVTEGVTHTGVVTFHELAPRLTRVQVSLDVDPGSLLEKAGRGMRHVKRAVRADLARYKAFIEMREEPTGAWRGTIRDSELVKERASSQEGSKRSSRSAGSSRSRSRSGHNRGSGSRSSRSSSGRSGKSRSRSSSGGQRSSRS
jgi:uncharacterized membrane protein